MKLPRPSAILFDMDGTLTEPWLDFDKIKGEMGIGDRPILETMESMSPRQRAAAEEILHRHEELAAAGSTLNPGCRPLLHWLRQRQIRTALITRNSRKSVTTVVELHGLELDVLITREDAPFKPSPVPLLTACEKLGVSPEASWMIGDGKYDVQAAVAAGIRCVWVSHGRARTFAAEPWRTVRDLHAALSLLKDAVGEA